MLYKLQTINNVVTEYPGVTVTMEFLSPIQTTPSSKLGREIDFLDKEVFWLFLWFWDMCLGGKIKSRSRTILSHFFLNSVFNKIL